MLFYGFLVVVVVGIVAWLARSPVARQVRRGHGNGQHGTSRDHAFKKTARQVEIDPLGQPKRREWE